MDKKIRRRIISIILSLIMAVGLISVEPQVAEADSPVPFSTGDGTLAHPYEISTAEQLYSVRDYSASYFKQVSDITIDTTTYANWSPIGTSASPFTGSYDGGNFNISNLKINTTAEAGSDTILGLFGVVGSSAALSNIKLK